MKRESLKETARRLDEIFAAFAPASNEDGVSKKLPSGSSRESIPVPIKELRRLADRIMGSIGIIDYIECGTTFDGFNDDSWETTDTYVKYVAKASWWNGTKAGDTFRASDATEPGSAADKFQKKLDGIKEVREIERTITSIIPPPRYVGAKSDSNMSPLDDDGGMLMAEIVFKIARDKTQIILKSFEDAISKKHQWQIEEVFDRRGKRIGSSAVWPQDEAWYKECAQHLAEYLGLSVDQIGKPLPSGTKVFKESYYDEDEEDLEGLEPIDPHCGTLRYSVMSKEDIYHTHSTALVGSVRASYTTLVKHFGEPEWTKYTWKDWHHNFVDSYCQWHIEFADHEYANIYDWRIDDPYGNTSWNIGAGNNNRDLASRIDLIIKGKGKRTS